MSPFQHRVLHMAPSLPVPPSPPGMPPVPPAPGPDVEPVLPPPGERPVPSPDPEDVEAFVPLRPGLLTAPGPTRPFGRT